MPKIGYSGFVNSQGRDQALPFSIGTSVINKNVVKTQSSSMKLTNTTTTTNTIDPLQLVIVAAVANIVYEWVKQARIVSSDDASFEQFGFTTSIHGDYAIVGAPTKSSSAGAAYIFKRTDDTWNKTHTLVGSDTVASDNFGYGVAIYNNYAIVGAYRHNDNAGAVYVFMYDGINWTEQTKIVASDLIAGDRFGYSVSIYGNYAIIGTGKYNVAGCAYIFMRNGTNWIQQSKLTGSDSLGKDYFGHAVSIYGDYAIVGSEQGGTGYTSSAYIFMRNGTNWEEQQKIISTDLGRNDRFGKSVSIYDNYVIVGANQNTNNGNIYNAGAAYVFMRTGTNWEQQQKLIGSDIVANNYFGVSVSIYGDYAVVSSTSHNTYAGAAYIFKKNDSNVWEEDVKIVGNNENYKMFGKSVSMTNNYCIVGAYNEGSGAAYIFNKSEKK